jgi:hypothetical protein
VRADCVASARLGAYWVTDTTGLAVIKHDRFTGAVLNTINVGVAVGSMAVTADRSFAVLASDGPGNPVYSLNLQTDAIVATNSRDATQVSVCDDDTIVTVGVGATALLAHYSIDSSGALTELASAQIGSAVDVVCSPDSSFAVVAVGRSVVSYKLSPMSTAPVDTLTITWSFKSPSVVNIVFNPATSDIYVLYDDGDMEVRAFGSDGMFGGLASRPATTMVAAFPTPANRMQFAFGKLFIHANNTLRVFTPPSSNMQYRIASDSCTGICISEGRQVGVCFLCLFLVSGLVVLCCGRLCVPLHLIVNTHESTRCIRSLVQRYTDGIDVLATERVDDEGCDSGFNSTVSL